MALRDRLQSDITIAVRSGDTLRRDTLRMAWAAAYTVEKRQGVPLVDSDLLAVLSREVRTRRESVAAFRAGAREDLALKEEREIAILSEYLPAPLGEAELSALVQEAIVATGATSVRDLGRVMGWLSPRTRGRADGRHTSERVAQALARLDVAAHDAAPGRH